MESKSIRQLIYINLKTAISPMSIKILFVYVAYIDSTKNEIFIESVLLMLRFHRKSISYNIR